MIRYQPKTVARFLYLHDKIAASSISQFVHGCTSNSTLGLITALFQSVAGLLLVAALNQKVLIDLITQKLLFFFNKKGDLNCFNSI